MLVDVAEEVEIKDFELVVETKRGCYLFDQWIKQEGNRDGPVLFKKRLEV